MRYALGAASVDVVLLLCLRIYQFIVILSADVALLVVLIPSSPLVRYSAKAIATCASADESFINLSCSTLGSAWNFSADVRVEKASDLLSVISCLLRAK